MTWIMEHDLFWPLFAVACLALLVCVAALFWYAFGEIRDDEPLPEWEAWPEPVTDWDADTMIAEWNTDLPAPDDALPAPRAGEHHLWVLPELERHVSPALVESLTDDPDLLLWDIRCQVTRIQEIRAELADLRRELCPA